MDHALPELNSTAHKHSCRNLHSEIVLLLPQTERTCEPLLIIIPHRLTVFFGVHRICEAKHLWHLLGGGDGGERQGSAHTRTTVNLIGCPSSNPNAAVASSPAMWLLLFPMTNFLCCIFRPPRFPEMISIKLVDIVTKHSEIRVILAEDLTLKKSPIHDPFGSSPPVCPPSCRLPVCDALRCPRLRAASAARRNVLHSASSLFLPFLPSYSVHKWVALR